ncbi:MAG: phenylacetate-CoA oxygenase subunit PaaC [Bacteroidetes bacterium]|nr:phenylacetate-CoA oxygenase subunit PaaC [Bacteroidota bacterium]
MSDKKELAIKELIYKMADDQLIIGHRNSEWTGLGPILEEDIAFSSMAQDKIGQAASLYQVLHTMGEAEPDTLGFMRNANQFHCCHLVELPIGEYDFSLIRHFLFDHAEALRFEMLAKSSFEPLAQLAKKYKGEIKYHTFHADTWVKQLGNANEEAHGKLQNSLDACFEMALGIFEEGPFEELLKSEGIFEGEAVLKERWLAKISEVLTQANLTINSSAEPIFGGRRGKHTEFLQPLLDEMTEVYKIDPSAEW